MEKILGKEVQNKTGKKVSVKTLDGDELVGLYFSAHWCSPCRHFTPVLSSCYNKLKEAGKKFEVVFLSYDRTEKDCMDYYNEMPWLLLPYAEREKMNEIVKEFAVKGIPTLLFFDPKTGTLIRKDGRECVTNDPDGNNFPWKTCKV